jgi:predicted nucleotidyltransferase
MHITKEHIISSLKKDKPLLQNEMGVKNLALFGSYANNSQREDSDIDFLIELKEVSYTYLFKTYAFLEKKFPGKKIQLTRKGPHLSEKFLKTIEKDLIYV